MRLRVVFFGTPEFAVPSLQALLDRGEEVAGVVCQPDRPAGRGQRVVAPPVKVVAEKRGLRVLQPEKLRTPEALAALRALAPELIVVAAYGRILAADVLHLPPHGCINVHASLLPRHRGAAPIQWAILCGDPVAGVTIMQMDEGMDTGAMLLQRETEIRPGETYGELQDRLSHLGAAALGETLDALGRGELRAAPQDGTKATLAPKIEKEQGRIDWEDSAVEIERQVRAFNPWPSAYTSLHGQRLKIHRALAHDDASVSSSSAPGCAVETKSALVVACGRGTLRLDEVQLSGKQRLAGSVFALGARLTVGTRLG